MRSEGTLTRGCSEGIDAFRFFFEHIVMGLQRKCTGNKAGVRSLKS